MSTEENSLKNLIEDEHDALLRYKSGESYKVNANLRDGLPLTESLQKMVAGLDTALEKLPKVRGTVYRTLNFDDVFDPQPEYESFVAAHRAEEVIRYMSCTSASTKADGYPLSIYRRLTKVEKQFIPKNTVKQCNKCKKRVAYTAICPKYPKGIPDEVLIGEDYPEFEPEEPKK